MMVVYDYNPHGNIYDQIQLLVGCSIRCDLSMSITTCAVVARSLKCGNVVMNVVQWWASEVVTTCSFSFYRVSLFICEPRSSFFMYNVGYDEIVAKTRVCWWNAAFRGDADPMVMLIWAWIREYFGYALFAKWEVSNQYYLIPSKRRKVFSE